MAKAQHTLDYRAVPLLLRQMRGAAGFSQRVLGDRLGKPQSWIYNCETANRRVDVAEFAAWCRACDANPVEAMAQLVNQLPSRDVRVPTKLSKGCR